MKNLTKILTAAAIALSVAGCDGPAEEHAVNASPQISIIPQPTHVERNEGFCTLDAGLTLQADTVEAMRVAMYLAEKIEQATGTKPGYSAAPPQTNGVILRFGRNTSLGGEQNDLVDLGDEGYLLRVEAGRVIIDAPQASGVFHGVQTLLQLLPPEIESGTGDAPKEWRIPQLEIRDKPRYPYRGMHLDVCRHFFPIEFVKRYIDLLALHKMNTFHWHLTEDQGWRIQINKYPKLTEIGGMRSETLIGHYSDQPHRFDGTPHGGFYTQDEVREVVAYAAERHITVIPEIELPGHALAALAAYPELSCTDGPFEPATKWGIFDDVYCAGDDAVLEFLADVIDEVAPLFPGEYFHIGGDECPKTRWKECPKCQARIAAEGLADEHELQSWVIRRIEKVLHGHGKRLIGWDEILEGGLAPDATVMSWRGMQGGIDAAQQGHDVIMTPGSHCYFDHFQADPASEPLAIGGLTTLKKVYSFEPTPAELDDEAAKHVLGAQANLWTEYIATPEHAEYMAVPRMCALAEVVWSPAGARDWPDFAGRLDRHFARLEAMGVNYSRGSFTVAIATRFDQENKQTFVEFEVERLDPEIRYTTDGSDPGPDSALYAEPFAFDRTMTVKVAIATPGANGPRMEKVSTRTLHHHLGVDREIRLGAAYAERYSAGGDRALINGLSGTENYRDGNWQGYEGVDLEAVVDLGEATPVHRVSACFLANTRSWIFPPRRVEFAVSVDGEEWTVVGTDDAGVPDEHLPLEVWNVGCMPDGAPARYVKLTAVGVKECPDWHSGAGGKAWIFCDEIIVE